MRVARELHDGLLQDAMTIALQLRAVLPDVRAASESAARALTPVLELAERTTAETRHAIMGLRPTSPPESLVAAVKRVVRELLIPARVSGLIVIGGRAREVGSETQHAVVRIVREAVTNAVRHSDAATVQVTVLFGHRRLRVAIRDNGRGFDLCQVPGALEGHFGVAGMRERARDAGGFLRMHSFVGGGTTVQLSLQLPSARRCLNAPHHGYS
jgi:signal transduction histidine kinase